MVSCDRDGLHHFWYTKTKRKHTKGNLDSLPASSILHCLSWHSVTANQNSHRGNESPNQIKGVDISMSIESLYHHLLLPVFAVPEFCANTGGN